MFLEEQEHLGWLMFTRAISLCICWFRRASSRPCIVFCLALWDALDVPPNSEDEPGFSRIRGILWLLPGCAEERPRLLLLDPGARVGQGLFTQPDPGTFQRQTSKRLLKQSGGLSHVVNMGSNRTTTLRCIFTMLGDPSGLSHAEVADSLFLILDVLGMAHVRKHSQRQRDTDGDGTFLMFSFSGPMIGWHKLRSRAGV